jgi:predicted N-acetyltransferase YhbS
VPEIRPATNEDRDAIWKIFRAVFGPGDTYAVDPHMSREEALAYWFRPGTHTYVVEQDRHVVGTYILKPNQAGPGSHVANAAFMVAPDARGQGIGRAMGEHCLSEARRLVFAQCNLTLSFRQTHRRFTFGSDLVSGSSALCQARFSIRKKGMSMFTSCIAHCFDDNIPAL